MTVEMDEGSTNVYADLGYGAGDFPEAEAVSRTILPLPMYPELTEAQCEEVVTALLRLRTNDSAEAKMMAGVL